MSDVAEKPVVETVTIEVDGISMDVPKGAMIIEATDRAGIHIPRFCYHPKLSIAANCRMCLVDVEKAPKPLPACATPVMDGMKVYTRSHRAVSAQQNVMEFLLINHPLDCPICDQGGECELQDISIGHGHSVSRYVDRKRSVKDENLGALISTEMTRCIHCTRCVRFLDEIAGTNELGGMGRGDHTFISTYVGRSIDSELSGNIIDLCPVGALTNKPFRFRARSWEMRAAPSISSHDAVGSNIVYHRQRGRILRAVPAANEAVNENWLSDRDRWGFHGIYSDDRITQPEMKNDRHWQKCGWPTAIKAAADTLSGVDASEIGFLVSAQNSNENLYSAQKLARSLGCHNIDHRIRQIDFVDDQSRVLTASLGGSIASLASADAILIIGANIRHDQPILGHRVRQASHAGAAISVINPYDYPHNFDLAAEVICKPSLMVSELAAVARSLGMTAKGALGKLIKDSRENEASTRIAKSLKSGERGRVLLGQNALGHANASALRALATLICQATGASYGELPAFANAAGAMMMGVLPHREAGMAVSSQRGQNVSEMINGSLKVIVIDGFEPTLDCLQAAGLQQALSQAEQVIVISPYVTDAIREVATLILPSLTFLETGGSLVNAAGQWQSRAAASKPDGDGKDSWKIYKVIADQLKLEGFDYQGIGDLREEISGLDVETVMGKIDPVITLPVVSADNTLELQCDYGMVSSDPIVRRSDHLQKTSHASLAAVRLNPLDAERLGVVREETVRLNGELLVAAIMDENQPEGSLGCPMGVEALSPLTAHVSVAVEADA